MILIHVTRVAPVLLAMLGLAACGGSGDPEQEAQDAVRQFIKATNERDEATFCGEVVTQQFREQLTAAKGDKATEACEEQLKRSKAPRLQLVRIARTELDGDEGKVTAEMRTQGQPLNQVFQVREEDGDWRIAGGGGG